MPGQLEYTDQAVDDLDTIRRWLTQPGAGPAARRKLNAIWTMIERVAEHPHLYPSGARPGVRELPLPGGYRALYCVTPQPAEHGTASKIRVLRVFGPGQNRSAS